MSSGLILEVGGHGSAHLDDLCTAILKEEVVRESIGHTVSKIRTKLVRAQIVLSTVLKFPLVVASPGGIERFLRPERCHTSDYRENTPTLNEDRQAIGLLLNWGERRCIRPSTGSGRTGVALK